MLRADRAGQQRGPAVQGDRGHGQPDLVQQPGIVELPGQVAAADYPDRPLSGCRRDRREVVSDLAR
jgi:hypothetical protein